MLVEIASCDFPNLIGAVDQSRDTWHQIPRRSGFGVRGFRHQGKLASWIRDPRNPEGDVAAWDPGSLVEDRWHHIGGSVPRGSGFGKSRLLTSQVAISR
jgi:hypothetical protein